VSADPIVTAPTAHDADDAPPILWGPSADAIERTALAHFRRWLGETRGLRFDSYDALWAWSVDRLEEFWAAIWEYFQIAAHSAYDAVLGSREMPGAQWFAGATLNWAEHVLRTGRDGELAILFASERRPEPTEITWAELRELTARIATGLRRLGVGPGDRVAAFIPNIPEAIAGLLASASIGAVWSSCSPDFGARTVLDRFAQIEPKVLLAVDGYSYGGSAFDRRQVVEQLRDTLPSLEHVVLLAHLDGGAALDGATAWESLIEDLDPLAFEPVPFSHPLWVLYSSGTTGSPKGIVHGHGGVLLEQLKHNHLHLDVQSSDRVFWFTTTGWMMWNLLAGCMLTGAAIVLFDGNPGYPDLGTLWDLAARTRTTHFGTSATFIAGCMKADVAPAEKRDLSSLRAVASTGSPLSPDGFRWIYAQLGDVWLASVSGGSDLCTAFVCGNPQLPVYAGEIQCRALGAKVEAWDEVGTALVGQVGELVLTEPMPSMPLYLWNDPTGERMKDAYFSTFPGVWRHGDWIEITRRGTAIIHGRSDSTINRGGIRMGTAEIYAAVLSVEEIADALVVDIHRPGSEGWMPLFVVLADGATLDADLIGRIARRIREDCSPRHVPNDVFEVPEIPRTLSGKALEVPIKRLLGGAQPAAVASRDALANPKAFDWFADFAAGLNPTSAD
jgi:acetoacetyl-CoA synthetase